MLFFSVRIIFVLAWAVPALLADEARLITLGDKQHDLQTSAGLRSLQTAAEHALTTNPPPKIRRGLSALRSLAAQADSPDQSGTIRDLMEVVSALHNNERTPVPRSIDLFQLPFVHYRYISGRVGVGTAPPSNLSRVPTGTDASDIDPLPSTFWSQPPPIPSQNFRIGFGRDARPRYEETMWSYARPKTSYGANAGFEARAGDVRLKIKFGEIHSEPFAARIFHALGYSVQPTDYSPGLKVKYDRRLFAEFNSRKPVDARITALGFLPVWTIHFQPKHDPFAFIARAVMQDGTVLKVDELRARWQDQADSSIDYLVTVPANVQIEDRSQKSIGPWDFGQLGHERRRELRGAGLLAAWLGWFDSRFDNTRLVVQNGSRPTLKHVFADLGGGLGRSIGWAGWRGELPEEFPDRFTRPAIQQGPGRMTIPFRIVNFRPIESTPAFREMTVDDARWMARRIAQLTESQIVEALRASGFDEATVEIYRRKLLSRREHLMRDLATTVTASPKPNPAR
jgi:hypothetical protein